MRHLRPGVNRKVLVEEIVKFFKGAQRTENTAGYKFERREFVRSRRHDLFPFPDVRQEKTEPPLHRSCTATMTAILL